MTNTPIDCRTLCMELLDKYDLEWRARKRLKEVLAQLETRPLTVQECNGMCKHNGNCIYESRDGKEIQLDGWFTREDLIELANTRPTTR
jgi:hypothetical protein